MLRRLFARLFRRRAGTRPPQASAPLVPARASRVPPRPAPPPPDAPPAGRRPAPPPPAPPGPAPVPDETAAGHPIRLVLEDGTVVDPPEDPELREKMAYLADNLLTTRPRDAADS